MQPTFPAAFIAYCSNSLEHVHGSFALRSHALVLALTLAAMLIGSRSATGQIILSPSAAPTNHTPTQTISETPKPAAVQLQNPAALAQLTEQTRTSCIQGRRRIAGRVLQIVPEGLVVDSGYPDLLRPELSRSWVARNNVSASRPPNLVEETPPGSLCVGLVFVTDVPKKPTVKVNDYVILEAYPAGQHSYEPVTPVKKTIRTFSVGLVTAVQLNLDSGKNNLTGPESPLKP